MLLLILLFIGILLTSIGYVKSENSCPAPIIEYRYIPRTFQEEQDNPTKVTEIFETMFDNQSPWISDRTI